MPPKDWLPGLDSNQEIRLQRPLCYQLHYRAVLRNFVTCVHMLGPNCPRISSAQFSAAAASANRPNTVAPLPLINVPAAPPARIASLSNCNTGNFPTDGASSELYNDRQTPSRSSSANARTSRLTSGGRPVNVAAQFAY